MCELICLGGVGAWTLITVIDLHAETPGLIDNCGGWTICRMLLAVLAFTYVSSLPLSLFHYSILTRLSKHNVKIHSWISFLFQCLSFASLLLSTLYFSIRRSSPIPTLFTPFSDVDWIRYSGRPVNRSATVKRINKSKTNTSSVPEDSPNFEEELKAPSKKRFEGRDSQVPVLAKSIHSYGGSIGGGGQGDDSFTVDWDGQSSQFERNQFRDSTATGVSERPPSTMEQVFILVTEGEKDEEEKEKEKNEVENGNGNGTGTAM